MKSKITITIEHHEYDLPEIIEDIEQSLFPMDNVKLISVQTEPLNEQGKQPQGDPNINDRLMMGVDPGTDDKLVIGTMTIPGKQNDIITKEVIKPSTTEHGHAIYQGTPKTPQEKEQQRKQVNKLRNNNP